MRNKDRNLPPKWLDRFFGWFCRDEELEILRGDLYELYAKRFQKRGRLIADVFFCLEVLDLFRPFVIKNHVESNHTIMFHNYLRVLLRTFARQKLYSILNISGLVIGLTCFMLIFLFIQDELSYDRFHTKADRIYRIVENFESEGVGEHSASLPFPTGPTVLIDYEGRVENSVRLFNFQSPTLTLANKTVDKAFNESRLFFADSTFLDIFDFQLIEGNREKALDQPNAILITESMAKKYFGEGEAMGKILEFQGQQNLHVTGILADSPVNSHFQFDFIVSFSSLTYWYNGHYPQTWYWNPCWTYLLLHEDVDPRLFEEEFQGLVSKHFPDFIKDDVTLELQRLLDIHLHSKLDYEIEANSDIKTLYIFGIIAIIVLTIAAINFINLSTARATKRAKEVGVRKTLGSKKYQLVAQFVFESVVMTFLSIILSFFIVLCLLPWFNGIVEKSIGVQDLLTKEFLSGAISLSFLVGLLSGFYPAFVLSSFKIVNVLKQGKIKTKGLNFRRILVTTQFAISIFLIVGTIVAIDQFHLLQNKEVGFDQEYVLMIPVVRSPMGDHYTEFKEMALQSPLIQSVTAVEEIIGAKHQVENYRFEGMERSKPFPRFYVLHDFTRTMEIDLVAGRDYKKEFVSDDSLALVINEAMVQAMNWESAEEAINKRFYYKGQLKGKIVGVVKDYHFTSKHHPIGPIVLDLNTRPSAFNLFIKYLAVKVDANNWQQAKNDLEKAWTASLPQRPFDYFFLSDRLIQSYKTEQKLRKITVIFSILAIGVACLGLFGLTTFNLERRTREMGLRKILGINAQQIFLLLSKDFIFLILIALIISIPSAYLFIERWLSEFPYRVSIDIWPFLIAGVITLIVSLLTIVYHVLKASWINPIEALRYE